MKNYKIFVAFEYCGQDQDPKFKISFAFADDDLKLHFGGSPKKSYLLTPAQAANVFFADHLANSHNYYAHCMDITKKELKTLRKEFKKQGFMPYDFFENVMLHEKHFADATVVLKQEPRVEKTDAPTNKCKRKLKAFCLRRFLDEGVPSYFGVSSEGIAKLYRTHEDADFAAYEQEINTGIDDWEVIEFGDCKQEAGTRVQE